MFALEKINHLEKGKKQYASFSSKEIFKKAQFREHSLMPRWRGIVCR
jgi:hypothetical protein